MPAKNDITGDSIKSKPNSKAFEDNFDAIFRKKQPPVRESNLTADEDDWDEKRIDIIGSNGSTGDHYNQS